MPIACSNVQLGRLGSGMALRSILVDSHNRVAEFNEGVVQHDDLDRDDVDAVGDPGDLLEGDRPEPIHVERLARGELVPHIGAADRKREQPGALGVAGQSAVVVRDVCFRPDSSQSHTGSSQGRLGDLRFGVATLGWICVMLARPAANEGDPS